MYDIIPAQDETISIGSATKKFNELYLSGNTIYIGNKTISVTENGEIAFPAGTPIKLGNNTIGVDSNGDVVFGDTRSTEQSPINPGIKIGNKTISVDSDGAIAFPSGTPLKLGDNLIDIDDSGDFRFQAMEQGSPVARGFRIGNVRIGDDNGSFAITNAITNNIAGLSSLGAIRQNLFSASHTLDMDDAGSIVEITSASNLTITVPADSTANFPVGTEIALLRLGTGTITVAPAAGVTLVSDTNKRKIKVQYTGAALRKLSANS